MFYCKARLKLFWKASIGSWLHLDRHPCPWRSLQRHTCPSTIRFLPHHCLQLHISCSGSSSGSGRLVHGMVEDKQLGWGHLIEYFQADHKAVIGQPYFTAATDDGTYLVPFLELISYWLLLGCKGHFNQYNNYCIKLPSPALRSGYALIQNPLV